jgi:large subunit ribosomal protein L2
VAIIKYKPTSPGRRGMSTQDFGSITKKKPEKSLLEHKTETAGRNNDGRITSRFRGGGHKQRYRKVDFKRTKTGVPPRCWHRVRSQPHRAPRADPVRRRRAGLHHRAAEARGRSRGHQRELADIKPGNSLPLATSRSVPRSTAWSSRSAAAASSAARPAPASSSWRRKGHQGHPPPAVGRDALRQHRLPRHRRRHRQQRARQHRVGQGRPQALARQAPAQPRRLDEPGRPPDGGGEGRSSGGRHPCTPWGQPTKGYKTRHNKRTDKNIVRRRTK